MALIELRDILKIYDPDSPPALRGTSFDIKERQIVSVIGPSGSGKTTLLRVIAGLEQPDGGEVWLRSRRVAGNGAWVPPEKRGIGMVFQDYALFPHLSVGANVGYGLRSLIPGKRQERVREVLRLVGLERFIDRYPHELSGGEQQRVALARALAPDPVALLLDEPFSNLDAALRKQVRQELTRVVRQAGTTAIMVTHDQADALAVSDEVVILRDGQVEQSGSPEDVYRKPQNPFVAQFLGETNLMEGSLGGGTGELVTALGRFALSPNGWDGYAATNGQIPLSIRPEGVVPDAAGPAAGRIRECYFEGERRRVILELEANGRPGSLFTAYLPSHYEVRQGQILRFRVLPEFVSTLTRHPVFCERLAGD